MHVLRSTKRHARHALALLPLALLAVFLSVLGTREVAANPKYAGLVVDVLSGEDLYAENADAARYPASLTKVMTLYIVFEELNARRLTLDSRFTVSKYAAARPPSKIGFKPGGTIKVRDAIKALVTKSANDVATAIAENISGSEAAFAKRMTKTARRLGMSKTTFRNASGLPHSAQKTTARDMARLGIAIQRDFPQYYGVFQTRSFTFHKRRFGNHNRLLGQVQGVDGIKTGFIRASGFNLVTSVRRDGRHLVAVVMGGRSGASRNRQMTKLVERYLPKAKRGQPMVFAAWSDAGPPPIPGRRPSATVRLADRLNRGREDPIGATVLAFADEARAAAGTPSDAPTRRRREPARPTISAVVAANALAGEADEKVSEQPLSGAVVATAFAAPEEGPRFDTSRSQAPPQRAGQDSSARPTGSREGTARPQGATPSSGRPEAQSPGENPSAPLAPNRLASAFDRFAEPSTRTGRDRLAEAIDRALVPDSGLTIIAMGSAPRTVGTRVRAARSSAKQADRMVIEPVNEGAQTGRAARQSLGPRGSDERATDARPSPTRTGRAPTLDATRGPSSPSAREDDAATADPISPTAQATGRDAEKLKPPSPAAAAGSFADLGWQIQLGAVPSRRAAHGLLDEATRVEPAMAQRARVTVPVTTAEGTLYRARFAGFRSEGEARSACKRFSNHNRPCWAVSM